MKKKLFVLSGFVLGLAPIAALAQGVTGGYQACAAIGTTSSVEGIICKFTAILSQLIPFLIMLGVIYFIWGVISYVIASDEEAKKSGRNGMIYGVIGLAVIVGVWGLVQIVTNTLGITNSVNITYPSVPY